MAVASSAAHRSPHAVSKTIALTPLSSFIRPCLLPTSQRDSFRGGSGIGRASPMPPHGDESTWGYPGMSQSWISITLSALRLIVPRAPVGNSVHRDVSAGRFVRQGVKHATRWCRGTSNSIDRLWTLTVILIRQLR